MQNNGFIKIFRSILLNPIWFEKPFSKGQAWVDLLLLTCYRPNILQVKNGLVIPLERGECGYSVLALSDRWGWSRGKVDRFIRFLESQKMVQHRVIHNHSIINILNYDLYQSRSTNRSYPNTNKEGKERKEKEEIFKENDEKISSFITPKLQEIKAYCNERKNNVNAEQFFDYYESNGWMIGKNPMQDWKAAVRSWEKYSKVHQSCVIKNDEKRTSPAYQIYKPEKVEVDKVDLAEIRKRIRGLK